MKYIEYNREERDLCAHLFRLLLEDQPNWGPLREFLGVASVVAPRIYCEVALIRDAYHERKIRKLDIHNFVTRLCDILATQSNVDTYTRFGDLPDEIRDPEKTHPKHIRYKLREPGLMQSDGDRAVYGGLQAVFNAKPDLTICCDGELYVYEAKYTLDFDPVQFQRTCDIGAIWGELLFSDLGFDAPPRLVPRKLGLARYSPDISWEQVHQMALRRWGAQDFSTIVLSKINRI